MAAKCEAQVAILFCYRLIPAGEGGSDTLDLKKNMESEARDKFQKFEKEHVKNRSLSYQFYSEVGFFSTRIEAFMRRSPVELLVLGSEVIHNFNEYKNMSFEHFVKSINTPVVIIPQGLSISHTTQP